MKSRTSAASMAWIVLTSSMAMALEGDPYANETDAQRDARMGWWREAKFGMFIHWGVYSVPAGIYDGKPVPGIGEWIMRNATIPVETYRSYAADFNPVHYDPNAWAALAKDAGMRYVIITAKHHDGFALFPTETSKWNVVDATPWEKDLIAPLADAVRGQGMKFGLYYSQAQDWMHPGGAKAGSGDGEGWDAAHKGSFDSYIDAIAVPQTREIITRYQPDVLWWDTPHLMNSERAAKLAKLLELKPGIIHNNRLGGAYKGDTETPEQHIPATGFPGRDWETCMTMNDTWGYKADDHHWKSVSTLIRNLVDIASKGGNYLLNIGPDSHGAIPAESVNLLKQVGAWMKVNGESIYGTHASPFRKLPWGRCTVKSSGDDTYIYLHVFDWPADGKLRIPGLANAVKSATLLAGDIELSAESSPGGPVLSVPSTAPDPLCSTIRMVIQGAPRVSDPLVLPDSDGTIRLFPAYARYHGSDLQTESRNGMDNIGYWTNPENTVSWNLQVPADGRYQLVIDAAAPSEGAVLMVKGVGKLAYAVPKTGDFNAFQSTKVGETALTKDSTITLTLHPVADGWNPVNVRKVELIPQP